jgi:hypothetical protein
MAISLMGAVFGGKLAFSDGISKTFVKERPVRVYLTL